MGTPGQPYAFRLERTDALGSTAPINVASEFDQAMSLINQIDPFGSKQLMLALKFRDFRPDHFPRFQLPLMPFVVIQTTIGFPET